MKFNFSFCRILVVSSVAWIAFAIPGASAGEKKQATDSIRGIGQPLTTGLDMHSFNPDGDVSSGQIGEILFLFDDFLKAQGITQSGTREDLERIHEIIRTDYDFTKAREKSLDDRYDELKKVYEKIEEDLEDEKEGADLSEYLRLKEEASPLKQERNALRNYLDFEKPVLKKLDAALAAPQNQRLREEAINVAERSLYSVFASQLMDERNDLGFKNGFKGGMRVAKQFLDAAHLNSVPFFNSRARQHNVGPLRAKNQATNLVDPSDPSRFMTTAELAKMSHAEVADLDVSPNNPMWYTRKTMETVRPDTWTELENWISKEVSKDLLDSKKFKKKHPDFKYNLEAARKVLFWDDVKSTATSPKVDTKDAFGQSWKLKWGEETITEPVANRIRLALGAKFTDLTYANVGGTSHLLILPSKLEKEMNPGHAMPLTVDEFIQVMAESKYEFNARPFILESGTITESNADSILSNLPAEAPKKRQAKNLIGRVWIKFRESMVEAKHEFLNIGGPIALHASFADNDRAMRQGMLFGLWLDSVDIKEDNHRAAWMKDFGGREGYQYFEYFHDAGSSLGGKRNSGDINKLAVENETNGFLWLSSGGHVLHSSSFQLYRPGVWDDIEFSDHLAAAKHLVRLTRNDIAKVVDSSMTPDFYRECLTWRLTKRRDVVAKLFELPLPDAGAGKAPNIDVPLTTRADRREAAARYHIPLSEIENDLARTGFLNPENRAGSTAGAFIDHLVIDGVIQPYEETILIGIIRDIRHPSGFVGRMNRWSDGDEYESIRYQQSKQK